MVQIVGLADMARQAPVVAGIIYHVVFGLAVGVGFLPFQQRKHAAHTHHGGHHLPAHG